MTERPPFVAAVGAALEDLGVAGRVPVACSGGGDSLALLRACVELRDGGADLAPIAAHFDHRQRPGSAADSDHVEELAGLWRCDVTLGTFDGAAGASEATLRIARYDWLRAAAGRAAAAWVLTGHTADDQAETVWLRIIRGTGVAGLAGIPAVGPLPGSTAHGPEVTVVRPMLGVTGAVARGFLADRGVGWRDDPTNAAANYTRNRLRQDVLPQLEALNPRVREAAVRLAAAARDEAESTTGLADAVLGRALLCADERVIELREEPLAALTEPARRAVLRRVWQRAGWPERRMGRAEWVRLAALRPGDGKIQLPHGVSAFYATDELFLRR
ncbi:tRNA lysidine(34) synthetase TilS [Alienimonas californiensis]|uniref:tRNA(Ile)-lysidine synthase n=1 Tax=Alienimonas californiensis TaxID=2527989 RepID=A0A517PD19_9PLAN|nr:tRNA lysidine(34) synthetase TilS [Alienimonas californiensis]QDT17269.1 tRNA(Ile)-lysidine synthase [Alienimonas californiensis]